MLGTIVGRVALPIPDAPRNVRLRGRAGKRLRFMRIVAIASLIIGAWMGWSVLRGPLTHSFGKAMTARVEAVSHVAGGKLARWFDVWFSYDTGGEKGGGGGGGNGMGGEEKWPG